MICKNKLYKHHKSKAVLVIRNFSIFFSSFVALAAIVAIPTYINASRISETKASEVLEEENKKETVQEDNDVEEEDELLTIN